MAVVTSPYEDLYGYQKIFPGHPTPTKTFTRREWNGRITTLKIPRTKITPTGKKHAINRIMAFAFSEYDRLTYSQKSTWNAAPASEDCPRAGKLLGYQVGRWLAGLGPSRTYPAADSSTPIVIDDHSSTQTPGSFTWTVEPAAYTDLWALAWYHADNLLALDDPDNLVAAIRFGATFTPSYCYSDLPRGTHYLGVRAIAFDGVLGPLLTSGPHTF